MGYGGRGRGEAVAARPARPGLRVEGVPISEADVTATNGVIHRLSGAVMDPPPTVASVLLEPPYPLSATPAATGEGAATFEAVGDLVRLAWPLVNKTLTEAGPLTVLAPTDDVGFLPSVEARARGRRFCTERGRLCARPGLSVGFGAERAGR